MATNASHYFYIARPSDRQRFWTYDIEKKNMMELLDNGDNQVLNINEYFNIINSDGFELEVVYPGLLCGAGYTHPSMFKPERKGDVADFQLGFFFDHTTGLPVIPGSSVKGVLKSAFPYVDRNKPEYTDKYKKEKLEYINSIINSLPKKNKDITKEDIFEVDDSNWQQTFFNKKLVFLDAFITGCKPEQKIFADDYITPHEGIFKNPKPLRFLKIAPGVKFMFSFLFPPEYSEEKKKVIKEVFKQIILDFGICAKRNVGYGAFKEVPNTQ